MERIQADDVKLTLFNDDKDDKPVFKREHLIHLQILGTFGVTDGNFSQDQRKWTGNGDICIAKKQAKKRMSYSSRDVGQAKFSQAIIDPYTRLFRGSEYLRCEKPDAETKLYPMSRENRTLVG